MSLVEISSALVEAVGGNSAAVSPDKVRIRRSAFGGPGAVVERKGLGAGQIDQQALPVGYDQSGDMGRPVIIARAAGDADAETFEDYVETYLWLNDYSLEPEAEKCPTLEDVAAYQTMIADSLKNMDQVLLANGVKGLPETESGNAAVEIFEFDRSAEREACLLGEDVSEEGLSLALHPYKPDLVPDNVYLAAARHLNGVEAFASGQEILIPTRDDVNVYLRGASGQFSDVEDPVSYAYATEPEMAPIGEPEAISGALGEDDMAFLRDISMRTRTAEENRRFQSLVQGLDKSSISDELRGLIEDITQKQRFEIE